ncbi:MAG: methyltransferase [Pseudomonadota bacterium]
MKDRWLRFRDDLLQKPAFQRWAASFPLTRPIASKRSRELFDLVSGFVYSQVLHACVRLKLLEEIADTPLPADVLARRVGLEPDAMDRLLAAACALRLVSRRSPDSAGHATFGLGDLGAALLGNPGVVAMVEHHAILYDDLSDPVGLLRDPQKETGLQRYWAYAATRTPGALADDTVADYSQLMAVSQSFIADEILDAYPVSRHRHMMDVGGGEGAFVEAAAARAPEMAFTLVDLPAVAARASTRFASAGLASRATAHGADMFRDSLPEGADLISLIRVLYDHPDDRVMALLKRAHGALPQGGTLLVAEPMAGTPGAENMGAAYFGFYLLAMRGGRSRTRDDLAAAMVQAGFSNVRPVKTRRPLFTSLLQGTA